MQTYHVDWTELVKAFPPQSEPPSLLLHFAEWLSGKPWKSVGSFDLATDWSDSHFPGAAFHYEKFALFIHMPDGSSVGYWLVNGAAVEDAPVVWLGTEGDFAVLAPNLGALLARIASGQFGNKGAGADFRHPRDYGDETVPDLRQDMRSFLEAQPDVAQPNSPRAVAPSTSDFSTWIAEASTKYAEEMNANPAILSIGGILEKYRPKTGQPWEGTRIHVNWAGDQFEASIIQGQWRPLEEVDLVKPHLASLRTAFAAKAQGLGLWHQADVMVYKDNLTLSADYLFEPDFLRISPASADYKADQGRAPRSQRRIPRWLAAILNS